jgi:hypothetical protein
MERITQCIERQFPGNGPPALVREALSRACVAFVESGLADRKFQTELSSGSDTSFWSCVSEALVYQKLSGETFLPRPNLGSGPDFLVKAGDRRLWIEVICPEPSGIPSEWLAVKLGAVTSMPHQEILLRWTSAIKEKTEKLVGSRDGTKLGYLQLGYVKPDDIYVIAVNGCRFRHGPFSALVGISQFPYAAEAVFPIGPYQIRIDKATLKTVGRGHAQRFTINKPNGALVPSHAFLDPYFARVSAIWAVDFNGCSAIGNPEPSAVIHNPNAINHLPESPRLLRRLKSLRGLSHEKVNQVFT